MLTKEDLNNLGEWVDNGVHCPFLEMNEFRLYDHSECNGHKFAIGSSLGGKNIISPFKAETKYDLNKMCYPFHGKDLDFSKKKDYSWIECFNEEGYVNTENGAESFICCPTNNKAAYTNFKERSQASSSAAFAMLTHIIAKINEDFPSTNEYYYYPYINEGGNIDLLETMSKCNNIGCESIDGFHKLVDTNRPLLKQYFGIE